MTDLQENRCPACGATVLKVSGRCSCGNWYDTGLLTIETMPLPETDIVKREEPRPVATDPAFSDGSSASYYDFPPDMAKLQDLIAYLDCNAQMGEIGRAWMRYGRCGHSERRRDLRKIIFYAVAELDRLDKYYPEDK